MVTLLLAGACRSPLRSLRPEGGRPPSFALSPVKVEDYSRTLKRIRDTKPGEPNTLEARRSALEGHREHLDRAFRQRALERGLRIDPDGPYRLDLTITTVGEVRTKYIVYGILSGVAWGVATGLLTHNTELAVGLGLYELAEETLFWVAGSSVFGRYSAPVVVEAALFEKGRAKPIWTETYFSIWGGQRLKSRPESERKKRSTQLQASLERVVDQLFEDLEKASALQLTPKGPAPMLEVCHTHP